MTAYFDTVESRLRVISGLARNGFENLQEEVEAIDRQLVDDCALAAEMPGMPPELRDAIHKTILKSSLEGQPLGTNGPDPADLEEHVRLIQDLARDLHTVFHEVGRAGLPGFSDNPKSPLEDRLGAGHERRAELAAETDPWELWSNDSRHIVLRQSQREAGALRPHGRPGRWCRLGKQPVTTPIAALRWARAFAGLPDVSAEEAERVPFAAKALGPEWFPASAEVT